MVPFVLALVASEDGVEAFKLGAEMVEWRVVFLYSKPDAMARLL